MKRFWRLETKSRVKALRGRLTLLCGGVVCFSGCALIMEDYVELEAVDAEFYYDPHSESLPSSHFRGSNECIMSDQLSE